MTSRERVKEILRNLPGRKWYGVVAFLSLVMAIVAICLALTSDQRDSVQTQVRSSGNALTAQVFLQKIEPALAVMERGGKQNTEDYRKVASLRDQATLLLSKQEAEPATYYAGMSFLTTQTKEMYISTNIYLWDDPGLKTRILLAKVFSSTAIIFFLANWLLPTPKLSIIEELGLYHS